jgi:hypothetical protein
MIGWITTILASGPARKALGLMLAVLTIVFRNGRSEVKYLENKQINGICRGVQRCRHWSYPVTDDHSFPS